jgi:F-type H+-transporting ATPase subunit gamma
MFSRVIAAARPIARSIAVRGMATEKQLANQIQSTKNIKKITSSMKMVSAAKLKGDENRLKAARPYNKWASTMIGPSVSLEDSTFEDIPDNSLIIPLTSDKGLCGGVNSFISRGIRGMCKKLDADGKKSSLVIVGDKGRSQMRRIVGEKILSSATEVSNPRTFSLAAAISQEILACPGEYNAVVILYNKFVNSATYTQEYKVLKPMTSHGDGEAMVEYEFEPDIKNEVLEDLSEYLLCTSLFHSMMEGAASEQSARMAAMENATKNAGEMVDNLTLQYNRARQTRITTELIEIISGASAIEESN